MMSTGPRLKPQGSAIVPSHCTHSKCARFSLSYLKKRPGMRRYLKGIWTELNGESPCTVYTYLNFRSVGYAHQLAVRPRNATFCTAIVHFHHRAILVRQIVVKIADVAMQVETYGSVHKSSEGLNTSGSTACTSTFGAPGSTLGLGVYGLCQVLSNAIVLLLVSIPYSARIVPNRDARSIDSIVKISIISNEGPGETVLWRPSATHQATCCRFFNWTSPTFPLAASYWFITGTYFLVSMRSRIE